MTISKQSIPEYLSESMSPSTVRRGAFRYLLPAHGFVYLSEDVMKICNKCKTEKPLEEFSRDRTRKDGYCYTCKDCMKAYQQSDKGKEVDRRHRQSDKYKKSIKKYNQSDEGKEANRRYRQTDKGKKMDKRYAEKHPEKRAAQKKLQNFIATGKLQRGLCEVCGSTIKIEGHHEDYSKALDVIWLCLKHHRQVHTTPELLEAP